MLQQHIEKGRLEIWWKGVADAALKSVKDEGDRAGEETRRRKSVEKGFWNAINQRDCEALNGRIDEDGKGKSNGERTTEVSTGKPRRISKKFNGGEESEVNSDTDVEMKMDGSEH
jgi:hypothetical protein